jgi:uncharacterized protein
MSAAHPAAAAQAPAGVVAGAVADPAPLGLAALGITTMMLSAVNSGWIGDAATTAVLSMALAFGGGAQLIAGMWAFRRGNGFAATVFATYGTFWLSFFLLHNFFLAPVAAAGGPGMADQVLGLYMLSWAVVSAWLFVGSLAGPRLLQATLGMLALSFAALCAASWGGGSDWTHVGGWLGLVSAFTAIYACMADTLNSSTGRRILPG